MEATVVPVSSVSATVEPQPIGVVVSAASGLGAGEQVPEDVPIQLGGHGTGTIRLPDGPDAIVVVAGRPVRADALDFQPVPVVGVLS